MLSKACVLYCQNLQHFVLLLYSIIAINGVAIGIKWKPLKKVETLGVSHETFMLQRPTSYRQTAVGLWQSAGD